MSASGIYRMLRDRGCLRAPVVTLSRAPELLPYPYLYFDDVARLDEILAFLTAPAGRHRKTQRIFNPGLVEPSIIPP